MVRLPLNNIKFVDLLLKALHQLELPSDFFILYIVRELHILM